MIYFFLFYKDVISLFMSNTIFSNMCDFQYNDPSASDWRQDEGETNSSESHTQTDQYNSWMASDKRACRKLFNLAKVSPSPDEIFKLDTLKNYLDNHQQAKEYLWYQTCWYYRLDQYQQINPHELPMIVFTFSKLRQSWTTSFWPITNEQFDYLQRLETERDLDVSQYPRELLTIYSFAEYHELYRKPVFINPEPNEQSVRPCDICKTSMTVGYHCVTCLRVNGATQMICTNCSQNERHEQQFGELHHVKLVFTNHCQESCLLDDGDDIYDVMAT